MSAAGPVTYAEWVAEIDLGVADVLADYGAEAGLDPAEVWCDLAAAVLIDAPRAVAEEVCRVQLGFVPGALAEHWRRTGTCR